MKSKTAERLLADIPNQEGFRFTGIKKDGSRAACVVIKDEKGLHAVGGEASYHELRGWMELLK